MVACDPPLRAAPAPSRDKRLRLIGLGAAAIAAVPFCDSPAAAHSQVMLRPAAGVAGTVVQVTGRGFPAGHLVTVEARQRRLAVRRPDDRGHFTARIRMPASPTRLRLVSSTGKVRVVSVFRKEHQANRRNVGEVDSSSGRRVRWRPLHVLPGAAIRLRGSRFKPGERVAVSLAREITRHRATRRGSFAAIMTAPAKVGRYVGTVRTPSSGLRLAVTVERGGSWPFPPPFPPPGPFFRAGAVIAGAGDIAASNLNAERTAKLLDEIQPDVVYTTGDNAYPMVLPRTMRASTSPPGGGTRRSRGQLPGITTTSSRAQDRISTTSDPSPGIGRAVTTPTHSAPGGCTR